MSNTRHSKEGSELRQEKYCSSPEFERGLMANLVAKRCALLSDPHERELIYALQAMSHLEGGLAQMAQDLTRLYPGRLATESMQRFGAGAGQVYTRAQVVAIRGEIDDPDLQDAFLLKGELDRVGRKLASSGSTGQGLWYYGDDLEAARESADAMPECLPASVFVEACQRAAERLSDDLARLCLDPAMEVQDGQLWYFPSLVTTLREYQAARIADQQKEQVVTGIGSRINETLEYTMATRCMSLVNGLPRIGKTHAVKAWCAQHPGLARYVQVPSSNDEFGFFRAIAKALGVSANIHSKAHQLRDRIEDVLQHGHLMICFDEAHYCFPQSAYRETSPHRVNWIMTGLVNHGVPVTLVTTPQFFNYQRALEKKTSWTSAQFQGRLGHYEALPDTLSSADLEAVSRTMLPTADDESIELLVLMAKNSSKYLAGIDAIVRRARYLASKACRDRVVLEDIQKAITENFGPSDNALQRALADPAQAGRKSRSRFPVAASLQGSLPECDAQPSAPAPAPQFAARNHPANPLAAIPGDDLNTACRPVTAPIPGAFNRAANSLREMAETNCDQT